MATASKRGTCSPCQLCSSKIDDTRNRRNLGVRTAECATASLDRLCREVGRPRAEIVPGPVCKKCFQDLEKLTKVQSTADLLRARFLGYIRSNVLIPLHSPLRPPVVEPSVLATKHKRTLSSADVSSPVLSSTPSSHPPPRKRPLLVRETSKARKSLQFTPELSQATSSRVQEPAVQASPNVNVVSLSVYSMVALPVRNMYNRPLSIGG